MKYARGVLNVIHACLILIIESKRVMARAGQGPKFLLASCIDRKTGKEVIVCKVQSKDSFKVRKLLRFLFRFLRTYHVFTAVIPARLGPTCPSTLLATAFRPRATPIVPPEKFPDICRRALACISRQQPAFPSLFKSSCLLWGPTSSAPPPPPQRSTSNLGTNCSAPLHLTHNSQFLL
jgi:hypothetical protein